MLGHWEQALDQGGFSGLRAAPKADAPALNQLFNRAQTHWKIHILPWCCQSHDRDGAGKPLDCVSPNSNNNLTMFARLRPISSAS